MALHGLRNLSLLLRDRIHDLPSSFAISHLSAKVAAFLYFVDSRRVCSTSSMQVNAPHRSRLVATVRDGEVDETYIEANKLCFPKPNSFWSRIYSEFGMGQLHWRQRPAALTGSYGPSRNLSPGTRLSCCWTNTDSGHATNEIQALNAPHFVKGLLRSGAEQSPELR